ncbi:MAG: CCA tRNA nucleotidyltransferase [Pedosphaera sp.]|nr:CCA tRNA nucleotidyltransferase [Pedosphaera sp.]MSU43063.1 CCA tRNA nucleotidyltransferase [Pedosphaera sp.]
MRDTATSIVRRLREAGHAAYLVGGCVRDERRGVAPQDYDIATSAKPAEVEKLFSRTIGVGRQFGVMLVVEAGREYEVATFRADGDYTDGRRPNAVTFSDAHADAQRRDFTINGLFLDPVTGTLHDWVGGEADLRARLVRTIGDPRERFAEDHLRLLRAVRFAAQLDFVIEEKTWAAVQDMAATVASVSAERIRDELLKLLRPPHAARGLELLFQSGLMAHVLPELLPTVDCEQSPDYHPEGSVYNHIHRILSLLPADAPFALPWAALLHDIGKPATATRSPEGRIHFYGHEKVSATMAEALLTRLRFSNAQIDDIVLVVRHHMQLKDAPQMRKATLRRMLLRPTFALELEHHRLDCQASHGKLDIYQLLQDEQATLAALPALLPPLVRGDDLLALGITAGPVLGNLLNAIRDLQLSEELKTREEALAWAKEKAAQ